jgi:hypothetical protein
MRFAYVLLFAACVSAAPPAQDSSKAQKGAEANQSATTLTGVVDQKDGQFVLSSEDTMQPAAVLRAKGFSADNFARFVGLRVQVRGQLTTEGDRRVLTVTSLDDLKSVGPSGSRK